MAISRGNTGLQVTRPPKKKEKPVSLERPTRKRRSRRPKKV